MPRHISRDLQNHQRTWAKPKRTDFIGRLKIGRQWIDGRSKVGAEWFWMVQAMANALGVTRRTLEHMETKNDYGVDLRFKEQPHPQYGEKVKACSEAVWKDESAGAPRDGLSAADGPPRPRLLAV